jgi:hypothetical protein
MKAKTLSAVAMLAALTIMYGTAHAASPEPLDWMAGNDGCHVLLTEKECAAHRQALLAMPSIAQRYAYLEAQGIPLKEREEMCSCKRNQAAAVHYPGRRLHLAYR